jgi:hypothetical protein
MTIKEFNLLDIKVFDKDNLVYSGLSEEAPTELRSKPIKIDHIDGKTLIVKIDEQ